MTELKFPEYVILTEEEKHDMLVQHLYGTERDHASHTMNKHRYEMMLQKLKPGPFRERIQQLLAETDLRLEEVDSIRDHLLVQLPADEHVQAAVGRLRERESLARNGQRL